MKEVLVVAWDDVDLAHGVKTRAVETITMMLQEEGETVELDVSAEHLAILRPWLDAGHAPSREDGRPPRDAGQATRGPGHRRRFPPSPAGHIMDGLGLSTMAERSRWLRELREWCDAAGRSQDYQNASGKFYYPAELVREYLEHLGQAGSEVAVAAG